jgi:ketosteroid isomerase-like protein
MKKILGILTIFTLVFALASNAQQNKQATKTPASTKKPAVGLPYKASYSSNWTTNVSDADLKMVLMTYKDWADNNISGLAKAMGDTVTVEMNNGDHLVKTNADLMKFWSTYRDSLSSVRIDMGGWHKMYATDKKEGYIVTWYKEYDTYKTGKVDSASYHDINQLKDGKIIWYSQFKRPLK